MFLSCGNIFYLFYMTEVDVTAEQARLLLYELFTICGRH